MKASVFHAFVDELMKIKEAGAASTIGKALGTESTIGKTLLKYPHEFDLAGLGVLALPAADTLQHQLRSDDPEAREIAHSSAELGGLGTLAAPVAMEALHARKARALMGGH